MSKEDFIKQAVAAGFTREQAEFLWEYIEKNKLFVIRKEKRR